MSERYWVWGEDDQAYGPASITELRRWAGENRVGAGAWVALATEPSLRQAPLQPPPATPWQRWEDVSTLAALTPELELSSEETTAVNPRTTPEDTAALPIIAPLWRRAAAYAVDMILLGTALELVFLIMEQFMPGFRKQYVDVWLAQALRGQVPGAVLIALWAVQIVYWTYFHGRTGQTPAKRWLRLRVVRGNGQSVGYVNAFLRAVGTIAGGIPWGVGYLVAFFNPHRRALHDWLAGTVVLSTPTAGKSKIASKRDATDL